MSDQPATPFPSAEALTQFTSFVARGVSLASVSNVPVRRGPETIVYHEGRQPPAALPEGVVQARRVEEGPEPAPPQPPPAPTEAQLRTTLEQAVASCAFASANLQRATEVAARATAHRAACEARLADFASLDEEINTHTVSALRDGRRPELLDSLRRKLAERGIARDDLAASERAQVTLSEALIEAQSEADAADKAAHIAAATLSMVLAEQLAEAVVRHESEARRLRELVFGADTVGITAPPTLRSLYGDGSRFLKLVDRGPWQALRERLLADPTCLLALE